MLEVGNYRAAVERLATAAEGATFFVFSEEPAWARANLHLGRPAHFVEGSGDRPWEDVRLMAACRHFVIANSTLSWWGAWLGSWPGKRVVAPARCFASGELDTRDLCPPDWRRVRGLTHSAPKPAIGDGVVERVVIAVGGRVLRRWALRRRPRRGAGRWCGRFRHRPRRPLPIP